MIFIFLYLFFFVSIISVLLYKIYLNETMIHMFIKKNKMKRNELKEKIRELMKTTKCTTKELGMIKEQMMCDFSEYDEENLNKMLHDIYD